MAISLDRIAKVFSGRTGTGALETIKHDMGCTPYIVQVVLRDTIGAANQYTIGTQTSANVLVTVTLNAVYDLILWTRGN